MEPVCPQSSQNEIRTSREVRSKKRPRGTGRCPQRQGETASCHLSSAIPFGVAAKWGCQH